MKDDGSFSTPRSTSADQNCRLCWNCSLIATAFAASSAPPGPGGM